MDSNEEGSDEMRCRIPKGQQDEFLNSQGLFYRAPGAHRQPLQLGKGQM